MGRPHQTIAEFFSPTKVLHEFHHLHGRQEAIHVQPIKPMVVEDINTSDLVVEPISVRQTF